jgi:hypothetical protein
MPAGSVMVWGGGSWLLGVLEDGTTFQHLPDTGWRTLVGPQPPDEGVGFALAVTSAAESTGGRTEFGPVEIGIEEPLLSAIREGTGWERAGPAVLDALALLDQEPGPPHVG